MALATGASGSLDVSAGAGVQASPDHPSLRIPGDASVTTTVRLHGSNDSGHSWLTVDVTADNGADGRARVRLGNSDNLALNTTGSPFPHTYATSNQDRYPASFTTDGVRSTFCVSGGYTPRAGTHPGGAGDDRGGPGLHPMTIRAIGMGGRGDFGVRT